VLVSPVQRLAALPGALWQQAGDFFITQSRQHSLIKENDELQRQHQVDAAQMLQLEAFQSENQQLRNLVGLPIRSEFTTHWRKSSMQSAMCSGAECLSTRVQTPKCWLGK